MRYSVAKLLSIVRSALRKPTRAMCVLAALSACKKPNSTSSVQYGYLTPENGLLMSGRLLLAQPGDSIFLCGDFQNEAVAAVKAWAMAAGRLGRLNISAGCMAGKYTWRVHKSTGNYLTSVSTSSATTSVRDECAKHFPNKLPGAYTDIVKQEIVLCSDWADENPEVVLLHEFGHAWGMCDQYEDKVVGNNGTDNADNCDPNHKSGMPNGRVVDSVMGSSFSKVLLKDDLTGIAKLTSRQDIPGNAAWLNTSPSAANTPAASPAAAGALGACRMSTAPGGYFCGAYGPFKNESLDGFACGDKGVNDLCSREGNRNWNFSPTQVAGSPTAVASATTTPRSTVTSQATNSSGPAKCRTEARDGGFYCARFGPFRDKNLDGFTCGDNGPNDLCTR